LRTGFASYSPRRGTGLAEHLLRELQFAEEGERGARQHRQVHRRAISIELVQVLQEDRSLTEHANAETAERSSSTRAASAPSMPSAVRTQVGV
jgi:hypothetical protein